MRFAVLASLGLLAGSVADAALTVRVTPSGPTQESIDQARKVLLTSPGVLELVAGRKPVIVSFELLDPEPAGKKGAAAGSPDRYRAIVYDTVRARAFVATGRLDGAPESVVPFDGQPDPGPEEFELAAGVVRRDPGIAALRPGAKLAVYPPMPPMVRGSSGERLVTVGVQGPDGLHEVVGVDPYRGRVVRYPGGAPSSSLAIGAACGPNGAGQATTSRGTAGQFDVVVNDGATELWRFTAIRPAASTGTRASGVELRNVDYRGKRVLNRAQVPILNVQYVNNSCGPYRDWQWQESSFEANGTDVAPGVRVCNGAPRTILESSSDTGNFRGVAIYTTKDEVYLVSEMEAGWYRYLSMWRFHADGEIHPRFGFDGVNNSCICNLHNHHAYWRFEFALGGGTNHEVYEEDLRGSTLRATEFRRRRDPATRPSPQPTYRIRNPSTGDAYRLVPGDHDDFSDTYARGDLWVVQARSTELDDGVNCTSGCATQANLDPFVNGESIQNQGVVVWYAGHFFHNVADAARPGGPLDSETDHHHVVGPDLVPVSW